MTKLKLGLIADDKTVQVSVEIPAAVHRDVVAYARVLSLATGQAPSEPARLIPPMVERFMATDRAFARARRDLINQAVPGSDDRSG